MTTTCAGCWIAWGRRRLGISKTLFNARILPPRNSRVPIFVLCSLHTHAYTSTPLWHSAPSAGATGSWRPPITRPSPCQTKSRIYCWNLRRDHLHRGRTLRWRTDSRYPGDPAGDRHRTRSFFKSRSTVIAARRPVRYATLGMSRSRRSHLAESWLSIAAGRRVQRTVQAMAQGDAAGLSRATARGAARETVIGAERLCHQHSPFTLI